MTLIEKLKEVREALDFYGEEVLTYALTQANEPRSAAHADKGRIARQALSLFPSILEEVEGMADDDAFANGGKPMEGWQPISTAPTETDILLAAFIIPSDEAERNGANRYWEIAIGAKYGNTWCRVLGGKPTHWMPLPAQPATSPTHPAISHHKEE